MADIATVVYSATLAAARTVTTGSVKVFGVIIANSAATPADVTFTDAAGTTVLVATCGADDTVVIAGCGPWITQGLSVNAEASTTTVTVQHSQPGA
jgi:hypothetical protein